MRMRKKVWARPELEACAYFIENPREEKGRWQSRFGQVRPLHLDLGCGKCVFLAEIAHRNRAVNYIGVDISYDILGVGRRNISALYGEEQPDNVLILAHNIERLSELFSAEEKAERIYVNFCNPWPKAGDHTKRLTHTRQLRMYLPLLSDTGELWFKTDNDDLYLATRRYLNEAELDVFFDTMDLGALDDAENVITEHERMFMEQGVKIKALRARKRRVALSE